MNLILGTTAFGISRFLKNPENSILVASEYNLFPEFIACFRDINPLEDSIHNAVYPHFDRQNSTSYTIALQGYYAEKLLPYRNHIFFGKTFLRRDSDGVLFWGENGLKKIRCDSVCITETNTRNPSQPVSLSAWVLDTQNRIERMDVFGYGYEGGYLLRSRLIENARAQDKRILAIAHRYRYLEAQPWTIQKAECICSEAFHTWQEATTAGGI